ncbi:MAG: 50S ribosomal protein L18 [Rhodospirillaceae bacterium]
MTKDITQTNRRRTRTRIAIKAAANGRARLSVFRSGRHIYAQVIKDEDGKTVAAASSVDKDLKGKVTRGSKDAAVMVGKLLAERAAKAGIKEVVFDRGSYLYHGRVKALADAAREAGLSF